MVAEAVAAEAVVAVEAAVAVEVAVQAEAVLVTKDIQGIFKLIYVIIIF